MRTILLTGISKGIGFQIAKVLLESDYKIIGISRTSSDALRSLITTYPNRLSFFKFDLANISEIRDTLFKTHIGFNNPIHGLVNNAAIAYDDLATNMDVDKVHKMFQVNVYAPMILTKYCIRHMILHQTQGSIIHMSSISAHTGYKGLSMYASSKGAIEAFSKNIAREWGGKKIRSNCIVAGFSDTQMNQNLTTAQKTRIYNRNSLKEATNIHSIANTVRFLLSDKSNSITGQNIHVDSGTI